MTQTNASTTSSGGAAPENPLGKDPMDTDSIRADFPILRRTIEGKPLIYFDNAATSLKPRPVIEAVLRYYTESTANIHRGVHKLSGEASELFEDARRKIAYFIYADEEEVVFVRNATEGVNLLRNSLKLSGAVVAALADHHSNMIPWMGSKGFRQVGIEKDGAIDLDSFKKEMAGDVALVCIPHISNALGVISPVRELIEMAHRAGALVMVDGSQSVPHVPTDVKDLDCDFLVLSGHKMLAPSGTGVLFGRRELLEDIPPSVRASFYLYNTPDEVKSFTAALAELPEMYTKSTQAARNVYLKSRT